MALYFGAYISSYGEAREKCSKIFHDYKVVSMRVISFLRYMKPYIPHLSARYYRNISKNRKTSQDLKEKLYIFTSLKRNHISNSHSIKSYYDGFLDFCGTVSSMITRIPLYERRKNSSAL